MKKLHQMATISYEHVRMKAENVQVARLEEQENISGRTLDLEEKDNMD